MMKLGGKTVLVTGATDGVGRLVATELGAAGAHVLVHGRDRARGEAVVKHIQAAGNTAELLLADLSSLAQVRRLAEAVKATANGLHILINNAGVGSGGDDGERQLSSDGHELRFAVNYLAGFLLTQLLLPPLQAAAPSRIVMVSSLGQQAIDFADPMIERGYSGTRAYCQSKLAQIMFAIDLDAELKTFGVSVNSLHPATYMDTTMVRQSGRQPLSTVEEGAAAILKAALAPAAETGGRFFNGLIEARANPQAYDAGARAALKTLSERLTGPA
jgi:NAD(P)-dependent dehydrogenase (short-subunit alcohol dehydrogenase family)